MTVPIGDRAASTLWKSPLHQITQTTPTCLWNDSCAVDELSESIGHGGVGATCNPVIAAAVLARQLPAWKPRILELAAEMPTATHDQIGWRIVEELSVRAATLLEPAFEAHGGRNGRLSIQTDPRLYRDAVALVEQAEGFNRLARNIIVKIPAISAGIVAIEEATYRGISINATVSFTLSQCVAVAEAVERGLTRRTDEGKDVSTMGPVCTIMVGRVDDWLKVVAERDQITTDPGHLEWAGVAVFKNTYRLFTERGYRTRLLSAAFRNHMHWSEFIGGDVVISPPWSWQKRAIASDLPISSRIDIPVNPVIVEDLSRRFPDFVRAASVGGLAAEEFEQFGPSRLTLRQFLVACADLEGIIRDVLVPRPDGK